MYNKEFGKELFRLRIEAGYYSQLKFAKAVGISSSSISRIESGKQKIEPDTLKKIAPYLRTSYEQLMELAGYLNPAAQNEVLLQSDSEQTTTALPSSEKERELVARYRRLSPDNQQTVWNLIASLEIIEQGRNQQAPAAQSQTG